MVTTGKKSNNLSYPFIFSHLANNNGHASNHGNIHILPSEYSILCASEEIIFVLLNLPPLPLQQQYFLCALLERFRRISLYMWLMTLLQSSM